MATYNLYSTRNRLTPDVYSYDSLPNKLKIQVIRIWRKMHSQEFEYYYGDELAGSWWAIHEILCDEYGTHKLMSNFYGSSKQAEIESFLQDISTSIEQCLDVIELVFNSIAAIDHKLIYGQHRYLPDEAIDDLNTRFLENGVGYEFRDGEIIRIDNTLLHREIIIPTLHFLSASEFKNADEEYLSAHEHFRHGRTKECLVDCLKAMESTIKIICDLNGWPYKQTDNISKLISTIIEHNLIPDFLLQHFSSLRSTLESGVPTIRNKMGGHGAGTQVLDVPMHYASYMLYLTGATINFLVSCYQERK
ncbi:hypothetical protein Q4E40_03070 [Pontibacter sp. BT731]|uniref:STM4504/CBY_0614 family protein n=1 Tax=Pontibacter coccineus TaxID=3063328 RepID=UPI0026E20C6B|nr:hypothetical protein [Pontibacter sp. BT731]MDO6389093.1 hypothetical protein [Pontibacter sp. BT731]